MMPEVEKYFRGFGAELVSNFKVTKSNAMLNRLIKVKSLIARQS